MERVNEQPGRLAIATALAVQHLRLRQGCRLTGRRERKRASRLLQATADRHGWPRDRFNELTPALYREVREHYRTGNDLFAQQVWGATDWATLFPDEPPAEQPPLHWHQRWRVGWESRRICQSLQG